MSNIEKENNRTAKDEDYQLVSSCQEGDIKAFEALVEKYQKKMLNIAYRMIGNYEEACEVVQDAFLSAYKAIRKFRGEARFSTWLYSITANHVKNRQKQMQIQFHREGLSLENMHGFPLAISKELLKNLVGNLLPTDKFNVLLFSGGSSLMAEESLPATPENIQRAIYLIERQKGGGGTELLPALNRALKIKKMENYSRTIVIATDGYVTVEEEVFDLIRQNLGHANMFAFGIGASVNRHIIEGMARVGMGEPFIITKPAEAAAKAERFRAMIQSPVLTQVKVKFQDLVLLR